MEGYLERFDKLVPRLLCLLSRRCTLPRIVLIQNPPILPFAILPHNHCQKSRTTPLNLRRGPRQEEPIEPEQGTLSDFLANTFVQLWVTEPKFIEIDKQETIFFLGVDFSLVLIVLDLELDQRGAVLGQFFVEVFCLAFLFADFFFSGFDGA